MRARVIAASLAALLTIAGSSAMAGPCRLYLVSQSDFEHFRGFTLDLEGDSGSQSVCAASSMRLAFGVGDGKAWRYIISQPDWKTDQTYTLKAVVTKSGAQLFLDDTKLG